MLRHSSRRLTDEMLHDVMEASRLERLRIQQEAEGSRELPCSKPAKY